MADSVTDQGPEAYRATEKSERGFSTIGCCEEISVLDAEAHPAETLIELYHERWAGTIGVQRSPGPSLSL
jgi:hypothetical protein